MKASVYSTEGKVLKQIDLPAVFDSAPRDDLVKRAVLSEESILYQPKGSYRFAGLDTSARYRGRKEDYGAIKNKGIPHLPHEVQPKGQFGKVKRVPHAVKGRRAHPPKSQKILAELINKKEHLRALASALAMCADRKLVCSRMHSEIGVSIPIIMDKHFETLKKTKDVIKVFEALNLLSLIEKAKKTGSKSPLIIVSNNHANKAATNLAGVDVVKANKVRVKDLAPGTHGGRLTIILEDAIPELVKRFEI